MDIVIGQSAGIQESGLPPDRLWLPLKTSDALVIAYREWLDEYAAEWPHQVGFRRIREPATAGAKPGHFDR